MDYTSLLSFCRLKVPAATSAVISDANALVIMNNGILETARVTKCLPTYRSFNTIANTMEYSLATNVSDYLSLMDDGFVYYYNGSTYTELDIVNFEHMNENYSDWQSASGGTPERAIIYGDALFLHPKPSSAVTNGIKIFYCKKPTAMDAATNIYPWGATVSIPRLSPFETIIVDYYVKEAFTILDINDPASARRSRAATEYYEKLTYMKAELAKDINLLLLKNKMTRLEIGSSYAESMF